MLSGEIIAGRVWSFRDCTDQKRSEQLMLKEKEFSRTLLESLPGIYYLYTLPELRLVRWNNNHETMTGYSHEELYHKHALSWFEPAEQAFIAKGIEIALEKGSHITETKLIKKDGQLLPLLITGSIFQDSDQTYMMGFGIDITERIRVETELLHYQNHLEDLVKDRTIELKLAQDEAIAANKAKSTFFSNMSHEIRTPLNAVLGFSQLLEREPSLTPQGRSRLQTIMKSGEYLLSIINDVLAMSRIEAGQVELRATSIDLNDLLHDLAIMFRQRADEKGISFVTNCSEQLPHFVMADIGKLRQVLINLIGNAIKFTLQGSITLRVYPCEDNYIVIEVEDTGIGISPEEQENLFRPFVRSSRGGEIASGTGLGLAISREYATIMGGTITVSSTIDIGSCFRFEFHAPAVSASELTAAVKRRVVGLAPGQGDIHILVVDDHRDNRDLLRGFLEQLDFIVDDAAGGVEAIEKMRTRLSHIILMDLVMPGMDGAETTRLLRASYPDESLTIIGISASVFEREKINFLDSGIDAFIAKPVRQNELFDILEQHAGIVFVEEAEDSSITLGVEQPTLEKMSAEWLKTFKLALSRGNITQIRKLGQEVLDKDPVLSAYLLSRADVYDLDGLKKLISLSKPA
jgi:PAS domain S-box-containing protein